MSAFKKAQKSLERTHRERAQPERRQKLGILEKGKDWKKRRDDFHSKERRINALVEKARNRNQDEFYFGMISGKTKDGVHQKTNTKRFTAEEQKDIRSQDLAYVTARRNQERKKIEKMQAELQMVEADKPNNHIVFVESKKEIKKFNAAEYFDTPEELIDRKHNRLKKDKLATVKIDVLSKQSEGIRKHKYEEMVARKQREKKIGAMQQELQLQKNLLGKGARTKVKDKTKDSPAVFKWKKERKK